MPTNSYIPAASGARLITWHPEDNLGSHQLLGWTLDPQAGTGAPVVIDGPEARQLTPLSYWRGRVVDAGETVDETAWSAATAAAFEEAVTQAMDTLEGALGGGYSPYQVTASDMTQSEAARRLVAAGVARWSDALPYAIAAQH